MSDTNTVNLFNLAGTEANASGVEATTAGNPDFKCAVIVRIAGEPHYGQSKTLPEDQNYARLAFVCCPAPIKGTPAVDKRVFIIAQRDLPLPSYKAGGLETNMQKFTNQPEDKLKGASYARDRAMRALASAAGYSGNSEGQILMEDLMTHLAQKGFVVKPGEELFGEKAAVLPGFWMPPGGSHEYGDVLLMSPAAHAQVAASATATGVIPELRSAKTSGKPKGGAAKVGGADAKEAEV